MGPLNGALNEVEQFMWAPDGALLNSHGSVQGTVRDR